MTKILKAPTKEEAASLAADLFESVISQKPNCVLGLATGSSPVSLYQELIAREKAGKIDFSSVRSVNLMSIRGLRRNIRRATAISCRKICSIISPFVRRIPSCRTVLQRTPMPCVRPMRKDPRLGRIDLQLLGIGHDGHIGFNEPDAHFPRATHETKLLEITRRANQRFFSSLEEVPAAAYTMGIGTVMAARRIVMVANGEDKAEILKEAFFGPVTPEVPASILQFHPDVTLVCDEAAAKLL